MIPSFGDLACLLKLNLPLHHFQPYGNSKIRIPNCTSLNELSDRLVSEMSAWPLISLLEAAPHTSDIVSRNVAVGPWCMPAGESVA
jgi:hypothetical protein